MAHGQGGAEVCEDAAPSMTCNHEAPIAFSCAEVSYTLRGEGFDAGEDGCWRGTPLVSQAMQVRRLMPVECERLQGFPDNYTLILRRGKPAKDGPRYKAIGNSWAVNCARWIGMRIELVNNHPEMVLQ